MSSSQTLTVATGCYDSKRCVRLRFRPSPYRSPGRPSDSSQVVDRDEFMSSLAARFWRTLNNEYQAIACSSFEPPGERCELV